ncbi:GNAT family N-acetyltransferase [Alteromonas lipolytica]|uniref:GNAT family N-acetyltransferase n=1 Tax=Alteromonas lipolytica TaxID=1856405 RepID=A0A1E8FEH0_9ALTE|nr:GNAT family N-acetyltransferase [Alteromonas lipolytica]OFI33988.1 GNAT family N-acetyltransferase [Alteromonas lipolytica]GGF66542.1 GNAT family acetyltransferase [Alteromonas lipolytica]
MLTFKRLSSGALHQYIDELAQLRMTVFRAFPYLYDGDKSYEARYLKTYIEAPNSVIVLAFDGNKVVGASTGIPLISETPEVIQPFTDAGFDITRIFYCGESVLLPDYRGQGAGVAFFDHREAHAKSLPGITHCCFCAVQRPENHPARPADYVPLDAFWQHRGYAKCADITTTFSWKEIGESTESAKPMTFWMKTLEQD